MMRNAMGSPTQNRDQALKTIDGYLLEHKGQLKALLQAHAQDAANSNPLTRLRVLVQRSIVQTPQLLQCQPESILACVYEACKMGLEPDTARAECHIVPRRIRGKYVATFLLGYKGAIHLATAAYPGIKFRTDHVCKNDLVWVNKGGLKPVLEHERTDGERGEVTHAYCIVDYPDGTTGHKVVDRNDIEIAKQTAFSSAWKTHPGKMAEKTAILAQCRRMPSRGMNINEVASAHLANATQLQSAAVGGRPQNFNMAIDVEAHDQVEQGPQFTEPDDVGEPPQATQIKEVSRIDHFYGAPIDDLLTAER